MIGPGGFRCNFTTKRGLINYKKGSNKHYMCLIRGTTAREELNLWI